jgi:hypothetical protein
MTRRKRTKRKLLWKNLISAVKMKKKRPSKQILAPKMNLKARSLPPTKWSPMLRTLAKMSRTLTKV